MQVSIKGTGAVSRHKAARSYEVVKVPGTKLGAGRVSGCSYRYGFVLVARFAKTVISICILLSVLGGVV